MIKVTEESKKHIERTGIKGFLQRLLYKFSGQKILGFLISSVAIIGVVTMSQFWKNPANEIYLKAIEAIKVIAVTLLGVKGIQNGVHAVTDYLKYKNGGEER